MKVLFIGGTGNISGACSRRALERGMDLHLLTRGIRKVDVPRATVLTADISKPAEIRQVLQGQRWDVVVNFIAFTVDEIERDLALFAGCTGQYVFISSASAYQKPLRHPVVTESTPLKNPFWEYSRNKIACEERLNREYRDRDFPMTIIRPSLTYDTVFPLAIGSWDDYTMIDRMKRGKPVVVHGDGTSLWTMTHSDDFALGFTEVLGDSRAIGHAFHITSDELLTWDRIWMETAAAAGCEANIVHVPSDFIAEIRPFQRGNLLGDKAHSAIFDNSKIKQFAPGYQARISWREGIRRTLAWFEEDPARMRIVHGHNADHDLILEAWNAARD